MLGTLEILWNSHTLRMEVEECSANLQNCLEPFQTINVLVNQLLVTWDNAKEVSTVG